jgi:peroxiredoxin
LKRALLLAGLLLLGGASSLAGGSGPAVGSMAPDFTAYDAVTHDKIRLSGQTGKVVILTFWASWCAPCRKELPVLETLQQQVSKDQLVVFAVPFREPDNTYGALVKAAHSWRMTLVSDRWGYVAEHYRISSIPHLFVIGRDGRIVA